MKDLRGEIFEETFSGDVIVSEPDLCKVVLNDDDDFLIMACDGLWDVITPAEAVKFVINQLDAEATLKEACEELVWHAIDNGSLDNITIIIADLGGRAT